MVGRAKRGLKGIVCASIIGLALAGGEVNVASAVSFFTVSVNNVGSSSMHEIIVSPGDFFGVDLNVSTGRELFDIGTWVEASASDVFDITGGFYHSPWDIQYLPIPLGGIDPLYQSSGCVFGSPGSNNTVGPGLWTFVTLDLLVHTNTPPGTYAINVSPV